MGKEPQAEDGNVYGRVLQRLSVALQEAERNACSNQSGSAELEVRGLTPAEFELIRAYLQRDSQWLSGWHAAAEEQAHLSRQALRPAALRGVSRARHAAHGKRAQRSIKQALSCALCSADVDWPDGPGSAAALHCRYDLAQRFLRGLRFDAARLHAESLVRDSEAALGEDHELTSAARRLLSEIPE